MTEDVAKLADKLNDNMKHAVMHAWRGGISCDIPVATQKALAKRGLATWDCYHGADLTPLGLQVQEYLLNKRAREERASDEALAAKFAAERQIYDEGYAAGQSQMLARCVADLLQAVYPGDPHPDRPNDTIFKTLVENIRTYLAGRRVTASQVEAATEAFHDAVKATVFYEQPYARQRELVEAMRKAMVDRAGIRVVSAAQPPTSEASPQ